MSVFEQELNDAFNVEKMTKYFTFANFFAGSIILLLMLGYVFLKFLVIPKKQIEIFFSIFY